MNEILIWEVISPTAQISFKHYKLYDTEDNEWMYFFNIVDTKTGRSYHDLVGIPREIDMERMLLAFCDPNRVVNYG